MRRRVLAIIVTTIALMLTGVPTARSTSYSYVGGGSVSVTHSTDPAAGMVTCQGTQGIGGVCIPFAEGGSAIHVVDAALGEDVAFEVCVDNNGDHVCGGQNLMPGCADDLAFSQDDLLGFDNPLSVPTQFAPGCPGGFPGWVVFPCTTSEAIGLPPFGFPTTGTAEAVSSGEGSGGSFCGGDLDLGKPYLAVGAGEIGAVGTAMISPGLCFPGLSRETDPDLCRVTGSLVSEPSVQDVSVSAPGIPSGTVCASGIASLGGSGLGACSLGLEGSVGPDQVSGLGPFCRNHNGVTGGSLDVGDEGYALKLWWPTALTAEIPVKGTLTNYITNASHSLTGTLNLAPAGGGNCLTVPAVDFRFALLVTVGP